MGFLDSFFLISCKSFESLFVEEEGGKVGENRGSGGRAGGGRRRSKPTRCLKYRHTFVFHLSKEGSEEAAEKTFIFLARSHKTLSRRTPAMR